MLLRHEFSHPIIVRLLTISIVWCWYLHGLHVQPPVLWSLPPYLRLRRGQINHFLTRRYHICSHDHIYLIQKMASVFVRNISSRKDITAVDNKRTFPSRRPEYIPTGVRERSFIRGSYLRVGSKLFDIHHPFKSTMSAYSGGWLASTCPMSGLFVAACAMTLAFYGG